ncbi:MAG TPA: hypothetical protein VFP58_05230 [Candidatus Eisenbacteria bacterium]|nr:hypothetical protein [Candidatus Eisenbacteria bacterium]
MEDIGKIMAIFIPILVVVGGITLAIVRVITQARLEELARRERIAAIERGADPEKLAVIMGAATDSYSMGDSRLKRAHGLLIGAFILMAFGVGLSILGYTLEPRESHWVMGLLPILIGVALLASSLVVWPRRKS